MKSSYDTLVQQFPELYSIHGYSRPGQPVPVYFSIGKGWYDLMFQLSSAISEHIKKHPDASISITDIKEKFGGLRYYYNGGDEVIDGLVSKAENDSYKICEDCGNPGKLATTGGWLSTKCLAHLDERKWVEEVQRQSEDEEQSETE